jgi:hypothetical protein
MAVKKALREEARAGCRFDQVLNRVAAGGLSKLPIGPWTHHALGHFLRNRRKATVPVHRLVSQRAVLLSGRAMTQSRRVPVITIVATDKLPPKAVTILPLLHSNSCQGFRLQALVRAQEPVYDLPEGKDEQNH